MNSKTIVGMLVVLLLGLGAFNIYLALNYFEKTAGTASAATTIFCTDTDEDGLSNKDELQVFRTNPFIADTDGDGYMDQAEITNGYSPTGAGTIPEGVLTTFQTTAAKSCS